MRRLCRITSSRPRPVIFATSPSMYQGSWEAVHTSTLSGVTDTTPARGSIAAWAQSGVS